ncbi:hypothetical protein PV10_03114 [Exophiala mesophila]|uniref:FAD-binding PCMH-type domain-containing protein n=1 Tax=Exophiala mesophila TaxID=212818 RepID=A0A0D1X110_EXOME|nr:uncharacterized protein PV10_03114 [Exophiala mesophila]KIV95460.1 hypothetical protein PV10_03114 [Exophiala mesophila]
MLLVFLACVFCWVALSPHLVSAQSKTLKDCIVKALDGRSNRVAFSDKFLFELLDVNRYNLVYKTKPLAITYPESAQEVSGVVKCAAEADAFVQARSGGHSFGNYGLGGDDGAVVVDMKYLDQLTFDESDKTAHLGPGNRLKDVNEFLLEYDRVVPHGDAPQVGVGGHYTIGGLGRISRQYGAATDQIIDAEVVLANGSIVTASEKENEDIFFAIRGAGASFGIVTDFHVQTHPAPGNAVAYTYNVTIGDPKLQAEAFKAWQELVTDPDLSWKLSSQFIAFPFGSVITGFYYGTEKEFSALKLETQLSGINESSIDVHLVDAAVAVGHDLSELGLELFAGIPTHFYSKSLSFTNDTLMTDTGIDAMFEYFGEASRDLSLLGVPWFVIFDLEAGKINEVAPDATAYAFRDTLYFLQSYAVDLLGIFENQQRDFLDGLNEVVIDHTPGIKGSYPGYVDPFLADAQKQYWGENLARLEDIKAKRDPDNVFRNPQSVELA